MNAVAKSAIVNACLSPEEFHEQLAGASAPDQAIVAPDQGPDVSAKTPVGHRPPSGVTPEAKDATRQAGPDDNHSARLKVASETAKFTEGQAAARALLDIGMALAETAKFNAGAEAARAILNKVAGAPDEAEKFESGAAAARALLGKTATEAKS
jgi:hypothetical protein